VTAVKVVLTWTQIQSLPPGAVRADLEYQYKRRREGLAKDRARQVRVDRLIRSEAERHRLAAIHQYNDPPEVLAARRRALVGRV
jgi:hypothetical protein